MQALQGTVNGCVGELSKLKEAITRTPNISKNLNRAIIRTEQAVNAVTVELTTGQSYIQRTLNLLQERLSAPVGAATPIVEE
jgi:F0F1-type ATP synthase delta subunit